MFGSYYVLKSLGMVGRDLKKIYFLLLFLFFNSHNSLELMFRTTRLFLGRKSSFFSRIGKKIFRVGDKN